MAAILPAISGGMGQNVMLTKRVPSPPTKGSAHGRPFVARIRKSLGKKEKELLSKRQVLRSQQPPLNKQETSSYRNAYKHNLFLDMLQDGFHRSFSEIFALIKQQNVEREAAGEESLLWLQTLLEDEEEKLDTLKHYLTTAEGAIRKGNYDEVYQSRYALARYFQSTGDKWLSDHFFKTCLEMGERTQGSKQAEAFCNMGLALEESGQIYEAAEHFEEFYKLSTGKDIWKTDDGDTFRSVACKQLTRIYTAIGKKIEADDQQSYLQYLLKAYNMAKEAGDKMLEGETSYRLGLAYERNGDAETALLYLNGYLDSARSAKNDEGIGKACEAIAKALARQGKTEESIKYLQTFVEVAEKSKQESAYSQACSALGAAFNSQGKYNPATDYFSKSYNISRALGNTIAVSSSRALYGISMAHSMNTNVSKHVEIATKPCLERIIDWKSNRGDEFGKDIPDAVPDPEPVPAKEIPSNSQEQTDAPSTENTENTETPPDNPPEDNDTSS